MRLVEHFRAMARNNAWSNHRLLTACAGLTAQEFAAERVSFFPSLAATLNHILIVDWLYLDALEAGGRGRSLIADEMPCPVLVDLAAAQSASDRRLIAFCDLLAAQDLERTVWLDRGERGMMADSVGTVLPHLFVHQIHHRGQAHAMLSGTAVKPPQLDEFFLEEDAPLRAAELERLALDPAV